jgi:hypothetical protein
MPPLFRRCWIFPWHFQTFQYFLCLNPTFDATNSPLKTISISKKLSRVRIVRSNPNKSIQNVH